jgi:hydroxyacylglutathione hydrolase
MKIEAISTLKDNYVWAVIDKVNHTALIVDPGAAKPVIDFLKQHRLSVIAILVTHHHWDHTNGIIELLDQYPAPVYGPANETIPELTHPVKENSQLHIKGYPHEVTVIEIPGHTSGHVAYLTDGNLFCGDTLFSAGCGRLFEGTAEQMAASLGKITSLPDETKIYCAHEYTLKNLGFAELVEPGNEAIRQRLQKVKELRDKDLPSLPSTLRDEKETNPFLRCEVEEVKGSVEKHAGEKLEDAVAVFRALRKWKDTV